MNVDLPPVVSASAVKYGAHQTLSASSTRRHLALVRSRLPKVENRQPHLVVRVRHGEHRRRLYAGVRQHGRLDLRG
jgi:hypothetical protein